MHFFVISRDWLVIFVQPIKLEKNSHGSPWIGDLGPAVQNYKIYVIPNGVAHLNDYVLSPSVIQFKTTR
jgi:hypothetical protein